MVSGWWKDTGQLADMLEANRLVLEEIEPRIDGEVDADSQGRGTGGDRGRRRGLATRSSADPAVIGAGAHIEGAYVGPYTSIGENVQICRSEIEHSIVLAGSVVEDLGTRMEASLLGREVKLTRSDGMPKTLRMLVGDKCEIKIV